MAALETQKETNGLEIPSLKLKNKNSLPKNNSTPKFKAQDRKSKHRVLSCPNEGCTAIFFHRTSLDSHVQSECGIKPKYMCGFCNYKCSFPIKIRYHIFKVHQTNEFKVVDIGKNKKFNKPNKKAAKKKSAL